VAIKILTAGEMDENGIIRFKREAQTIARLSHPGIVTIHDFDSVNGLPYLVLELVEGRDLWALMYEQRRAFTLEQGVQIALKILDALAYAHAHGVIHRDLKPENVMLDQALQVKVTDFGLAYIRGQSRITQEGIISGSALYMAPEVASSKPSDHRLDLYALGVMLYELSAGRVPFQAENPLAVINMHVHEAPIPPSELNASISPALEAIILKLLAKNPDDRFPAAQAVSLALSHLDQAPLSISKTPQEQLLERLQKTILVGRENEWRQLWELWQKVKMGASDSRPLAVLVGEAGTGKNEMAHHLLQEARLTGARAFNTQCHFLPSSQAYEPIVDIVRYCLRSFNPDLPGPLAADLAKLIPEISDQYALEALPPLSGPAERLRLYEHVADFFQLLTREHPLVFLIEYMHCMDMSSLSLLAHITRRLKGHPLLFLATYRQSELDHKHPLVPFMREMASLDLVTQIQLHRLSQESVTQVAQGLFGPQIAGRLAQTIHHKTQGNLFFTREFIKTLVADSHVVWDEASKQWQAKDLGAVELPSSIRSIITEHISQLSETTLEVLSMAAVVGGEFRFRLLVAISDEGEDALSDALEEAIAAQWVYEKKGGRDEVYAFINLVTQQILLERLNPRRQARLHLKIAKALEGLYAQQLDDHLESIARHYSLGARTDEDIQAAIAYLERAAGRSAQVFALANAVDLYSQALELSQDDNSPGRDLRHLHLREQRGLLHQQMGDFIAAAADLEAVIAAPNIEQEKKWPLLLQLGQVYRRLERFEAAIRTLGEAVDLARQLGQDRQTADALYFLGATYWSLGQVGQALVHQQEGHQIITRLGLHDEVAMRVIHGLAECYGRSGDYDKMYPLAQNSLHLAQQFGNVEYQAENLTIIGLGYLEQGLYERAIANSEVLNELCQQAGLYWHQVTSYVAYGMAKAALGDYRVGRKYLSEAKDLAQAQFKGFSQTLVWIHLGRFYLQLEALKPAEEALAAAIEATERHQITWSEGACKAYWAMAQIRQGNLAVGNMLEMALESLIHQEDMRHVPLIYGALAELEMARGHADLAQKWAENMLVLSRRFAQKTNIVEALRWQAIALQTQGQVQAVEALLTEALELAGELRSPRLLWKMHESLAQFYTAQNRPSQAAEHRRRVRLTVEGILQTLDDPALKQSLGYHLPSVKEVPSLTTTFRLLVISDTYGTIVRQAIQDNLADILRCDALILLGDLPQSTYPSLRQDFKLTMPGFCVLGNHDHEDWVSWLPRYQFEHMHLQLATLKLGGREISLGGFSGSERYRSGEINLLQWEERDAAKSLKDLAPCDILLSHTAGAPPPNYTPDRNHRGLRPLGDYIDRHQPHLAMHGHFHVNYQHWQGKTQLLGCYGVVLVQCMIGSQGHWQMEVQSLLKL
jgi:tetratricopeptide (TPR) repeat protein/Icc-related predicted phosphoesterase